MTSDFSAEPYDSERPPACVSLLGQLDGGKWVSAAQAASALGAGTDAVSEYAGTLGMLGYFIEAKDGMYRLASRTMLPLPWEIVPSLGTKSIGTRAIYFDSVGSTQDYARGLAGCGGTVIIAGTQTAGRGRNGTEWASPRGGIWMSAIYGQARRVAVPTLIPIACAVALAEAISETSLQPQLKWPNDVMVGGKKAAGIIVDAVMAGDGVDGAVIGIGINYAVDAKKIEEIIRPRHGAASLGGTGPAAALIRSVLRRLEGRLADLESGREGEIVRQWTRWSCTIGSQVSLAKGSVHGTAVRMDHDGALVVRNEKGDCRITAGFLDGTA